jgi:hypothetical protein
MSFKNNITTNNGLVTQSDLTNGTYAVTVNEIKSTSFQTNMPVKTNDENILISTKLEISDVNTLGYELGTKNELAFIESDTHLTPGVGNVLIYSKTDKDLYKLDSNGVESKIGGGSGTLKETYNEGSSLVDSRIEVDNTRGPVIFKKFHSSVDALIECKDINDYTGWSVNCEGDIRQSRINIGDQNIKNLYTGGVLDWSIGQIGATDEYRIINRSNGNSSLRISNSDKVKIYNNSFSDADEVVNKGYVDSRTNLEIAYKNCLTTGGPNINITSVIGGITLNSTSASLADVLNVKENSNIRATLYNNGDFNSQGKVTSISVETDTISEKTLNSGVTVDGTILKDSGITTNLINTISVETDTIVEKTLNSGVTVGGILIQDASVINNAAPTNYLKLDNLATSINSNGALDFNADSSYEINLKLGGTGKLNIKDTETEITNILKVDSIQELTGSNGVLVEGVKIINTKVSNGSSSADSVDMITGNTVISSSGVIDLDLAGSNKIKIDTVKTEITNILKVDSIQELTVSNGVLVDGVKIINTKVSNGSSSADSVDMITGNTVISSSGVIDLDLAGSNKIKIDTVKTEITNILKVDSIQERTVSNGVLVDGILVQDARMINTAAPTNYLRLDNLATSMNSNGAMDFNADSTQEINLRLSGTQKINVQDTETQITNTLKLDTIEELTASNGVSVDGIKIQDARMINTSAPTNYIRLDNLATSMNSNGAMDFNADSAYEINLRLNGARKINVQDTETQIKNTLKVDSIQELTASNGVLVDGVKIINTKVSNGSSAADSVDMITGNTVISSSGVIDMDLAGSNKIKIEALTTTVKNDLKTDLIVKSTLDNVNIEGSKFRTGGNCTVNDLIVLDSSDFSGYTLNNVAAGTVSTDAVNKSQLDLKMDLTQIGAASGVCPLVLSKIPNAYLPDLSITQVYTRANNAARDLISSVQMGDICIVSSPANNYIWNGPDETSPLTSANWVPMVVPSGTVTSVNSASGNVSLGTTEIPETGGTNRYYTPARESAVVKIDGSSAMTSTLNVNSNKIINVANGTISSDGVNKSQLDLKLNLTGGVLSSDLDMGGNKIVDVAPGTAATDAINKTQFDTKFDTLGGTLDGPLDMNTYNITDCANLSVVNIIPTTAGTSTIKMASALLEVESTAVVVDSVSTVDIKINGNSKIGLSTALEIDMNTNKLINVVDPTAGQDVSTKNYTDIKDALKLDTAGGTMTGNIAMSTNDITNCGSLLCTDINPTSGSGSIIKLAPTLLELESAAIVVDSVNTASIKIGGADKMSLTSTAMILNSSTIDIDSTSTTDLLIGGISKIRFGSGTTNIKNSTVNIDTLGNSSVKLQPSNLAMEGDAIQVNGVNTLNLQIGGANKISMTSASEISVNNNKLINVGDPTADHHTATKKYVDDVAVLKFDKTGGTLNGDLNLANFNLDNAGVIGVQTLKSLTGTTSKILLDPSFTQTESDVIINTALNQIQDNVAGSTKQTISPTVSSLVNDTVQITCGTGTTELKCVSNRITLTSDIVDTFASLVHAHTGRTIIDVGSTTQVDVASSGITLTSEINSIIALNQIQEIVAGVSKYSVTPTQTSIENDNIIIGVSGSTKVSFNSSDDINCNGNDLTSVKDLTMTGVLTASGYPMDTNRSAWANMQHIPSSSTGDSFAAGSHDIPYSGGLNGVRAYYVTLPQSGSMRARIVVEGFYRICFDMNLTMVGTTAKCKFDLYQKDVQTVPVETIIATRTMEIELTTPKRTVTCALNCVPFAKPVAGFEYRMKMVVVGPSTGPVKLMGGNFFIERLKL